MEITFPALQSINDNVTLAYNTQFQAAPTIYQRFSHVQPSTGRAEVYPRLDMLKGMREWIGDRAVVSLTQATFQILNRTFEETIAIPRENVQDDQVGLLAPVAQQLGMNAARLPDILIAGLMKAGHTTPCYDGQNFFDTAHPSFDASGNATNVANWFTDGSGSPPWYLLDVSQAAKPLIFQDREAFTVIPKFSMTDPQVFWNKEFEWGVDGRCAVGFGLWQLGIMSIQALTHDNVKAAIAAMQTFRRPDGSPMGLGMVNPLLVTGSTNFFAAKALATNEWQPTAPGVSNLVPNQVRGMFEAVLDPWLN